MAHRLEPGYLEPFDGSRFCIASGEWLHHDVSARIFPVRLKGAELMSDLVVIAFPTESKAEEVRQKLLAMQKEYLIELGDAVVAVKSN